ncbi:MAG TPA: hypothetical protein VGN72_06620 [Tepidisphaeraceae bacterium]|jgi:ribosomal protein S27E|nr:hypothetical protein [Tepidisphaeraceae bacterium]
MAKLPEPPEDSATVAAIYAAYEKAEKSRLSQRLGASQIGHPCARKLWFDFRWAGKEAFAGRMLRLFETGHLAEERFAANLRTIGAEVHTVDPATGQQFEYTAVAGHFVCKIDGAALGVPEARKAWHACEFKTHSNKSFTELRRKGLREAKPEHFAQLSVGMLLAELPRGLYLAVNKDTDELYSERLRIEEVRADAERLLSFAGQVVAAKNPPARIAESAAKPPCVYCPHRARCFGEELPAVTCRSCVHATAEMTGRGAWTCAKHNRVLAEAEQARACPDHLFIPETIPFAEAIDAGYSPDGDWVEYRNLDGTTWRNTKQTPGYRSVELSILPASLVGAGAVEDAKSTLGGEVVEVLQ